MGAPETTAEPAVQVRARLHVVGPAPGRPLVAQVVATAGAELGLDAPTAAGLADAAGAVADAVAARGFDRSDEAAFDVTVARVGHEVRVHVDDEGLPFSFDAERGLDGAALERATATGAISSVGHEWRGRDGNRTTLTAHLDPGVDLREQPWADLVAAPGAETSDGPVEGELEHEVEPAFATADDVEDICRLTWRTYGSTYQHDEYYRPARLAQMLESGAQVSFVVRTPEHGLIGHSALLPAGERSPAVEGGRAMVDPRFRGHHVMGALRALRDPWMAEHGVLALVGEAVTAHSRSQNDHSLLHVSLGYLPPLRFAGIAGTDTDLREAVVGGIVPVAPIPAQTVHLPAADAAQLERIYAATPLDRTIGTAGPAAPSSPTSRVELSVQADLGNALLRVQEIGVDLADAVRDRLAATRAAGATVTYVELPLDADATSWAADVLAGHGFVLAGLLPLAFDGVDGVRYQHLGDLRVDPDAIHLRTQTARDLLAYVLAQREARR